MKYFSLLFALLSAAPTFCANVVMPSNTGVLADGTLAAPGIDLHYTDTSGNPVYVENSPVLGAWIGSDGVSEWIGPDQVNGSTFANGYYQLDYQTTLDLTGYDPSTVSLTGVWATDNYGLDILVNGNSTGNTATGFQSWTPFTISNGFVAGVNTLDFVWGNDGGPGGLRVEFTSEAGSLAPEPASLLLIGSGMTALGLLARRRRNRQPAE